VSVEMFIEVLQKSRWQLYSLCQHRNERWVYSSKPKRQILYCAG